MITDSMKLGFRLSSELNTYPRFENIMKLLIHKQLGKSRRGRITECGRKRNKVVETPACMLYTRGGSSPHLTRDVLDEVDNLPSVAQIPANTFAEHQEIVKGFQEGIGKFAAMEDFLVYSSIHNTADKVPSGYNDKTGVAVWGKCGKIKLDPPDYIKLQESLLPDWYQSLCDSDTNKESGRKRCMKSVDRTLNFLDKCIEQHSKTERLGTTDILGSLVGGYNIQERERCARETSVRPVEGFVIEGFHNLGQETENFSFDEVTELMDATMKHIPDDKVRLMHSVWRPDHVILGIESGIDLFDSSYPYIVTERGGALVFDYKYDDAEKKFETDDQKEEIPVNNCTFEINLKESKYIDDFSPMLKNCKCYGCQNFTRAYINHLLNTSELLAGVILMIHNFHHYFEFFKAVRRSLDDSRFQELKDLISKQNENGGGK